MLRFSALGVVGKGVTGVDLDEVVDEQQFDHTTGIDGGCRVLGEYQRHQCHVPTMFGTVFAPTAVDQ